MATLDNWRFEPEPAQSYPEVNFLLPETLTRPLWKSLIGNTRDRLFPAKLPPLQLTSRPLNTGMLLGDALSLPWYRTVFTNLGNVINPENLPPLELESRPVDVGELVSDTMSHPWWTSLLRNLADRVAPERQPALQLTSAPMNAVLQAGAMEIVCWSSVVDTPKVFLPDAPRAALAPVLTRVVAQPSPAPVVEDPTHIEATRIQGRLSRSRIREVVWISLASLEVLYLAASYFRFI
jgi:hypothetical protein